MATWICNGGCPRSGTTAFLEVFNEHPNIGMFPEYKPLAHCTKGTLKGNIQIVNF